MIFASIVCSLIYGLVAGTFSGGPQLWIAPAKIAMGLMISALICLPSLYIFTCLSGSQARLVEVCGMLAGLEAGIPCELINDGRHLHPAHVLARSVPSCRWR